MRFSVVVPVYNVEAYIEKCMKSLVSQTFRDFEIIVVDDESPDGSIAIVEKYRAADPERIQVVHQKNTRQGGARNHGASLARGQYLMFVDSDDYVRRDTLEILDKKLQETPCDILQFRNVLVDEDGEVLPVSEGEPLKAGLYYPDRAPQVVMLPCGPVNKVFSMEFYRSSGVSFPEKLLYEDSIMRLAYAKAKSIMVTDDLLYYYVYHENSTMTQKISEKMLDIVTVVDMTCSAFREAGLYEHFKDPLEISLIYSLVCVADIINSRDPRNSLQNPIADYIRDHFPGYSQNAYASRELVRALDCLTGHHFVKYHYAFLLKNRLKDRILENSVVRRMNEFRKRS